MLIAELLSALAAHFFNLQWQLHGTYWLIVPARHDCTCALIDAIDYDNYGYKLP